MLMTSFVAWAFSVGLMVLGAGMVSGQTYPNKPIRIIASEPGGGGDFNARLIAQWLTSALGQPVIVENRSAIVANVTVAKGTPDGYTLLTQGSSLWIGPLLERMPYDPVRDFSPITLTTSAPNILVVHPSIGVKSVKDLIDLARAKPGTLNYASATIGSGAHLAAELFNSMAGVNIARINYKSSNGALNDVIGGQVQLTFASGISVAPHIKSSRLTALAVTSTQPSALFPGLPTVAASLPGYEWGSRQGIWAPAKTPTAIVNRLNQEIIRIYNRADVKERLLSIGIEAAPSSPEQFSAIVKSEISRIGRLIKDVGIRAE